MSLYTTPILSLAAGLADFPLVGPFSREATTRSRTCGSVIQLGIACDSRGLVKRVGMQVTACAIGQASAAIMAQGMAGRSPAEVTAVHEGLAGWLAGTGALPDWPQLELLAPALPYTARHGALMLPWNAATAALCSDTASG